MLQENLIQLINWITIVVKTSDGLKDQQKVEILFEV